MDIPIIIICYNNYLYVKNTLDQLKNSKYYKNVQILNNKSTCFSTMKFLKNVDVKVIHNLHNNGPWISKENNKHLYDILPNKFIITDPDLNLNENIPSDFIEILSNLSDKYKTSKIGFALKISDYKKFYDGIYFGGKSIYEWEKQFWTNKIRDDYELYEADIDTTFCLINKDNFKGRKIRVAGNFTATHLPWYIENEIYNAYENYIYSTNSTSISTISKMITSYTENNYFKIYKNDELFLIKQNLHFFNDTENESFEIFDKYLSKDKIFINIGQIGITTMYGTRKSKHTYTTNLDINYKSNCKNFTVINDIFDEMLEKISEVSIINVDMNGKEENILNELFDIRVKYNVPLYIKFHYSLWKDKNLDRFSFLSSVKSNIIIPFISIIF